MEARTPRFDLSGQNPVFGSQREACALINGGNIIVAAVERFLIQVMRRARQELDPLRDAALLEDVAIFNQQEGQHFRVHAAYLERIRDGGYPRIQDFERAYEEELQGFLAHQPLDWLLAYCEGFESSGTAMAESHVDGFVAELCGDPGSPISELWKWHLAEEFEHRTVVHRLLRALYPPERALFLRRSGADFCRAHMERHSSQARQYLLACDRAAMTPEELEASREREGQAGLALAARYSDRLAWVYAEDYDPERVAPPRDYEQVLARYSRGRGEG